MKNSKSLVLTVVLAVMGFLSTARSAAGQNDPPTRVARLSYAQGAISFQPAGENDWFAAVPNRPLITGDRLWADNNSRAELHVGSTVIRMGQQTGIGFLELNDGALQLQLASGSVILRVRHLDDDSTIEVDTPNLAFTVLRTGEYRIEVSPNGDRTVTTAWQGRGEVTGGGRSFPVVAGQRVIFSGLQSLDYAIGQVPQPDEFDRWAFERDRREDASEAANYVSREMTGYEDLDRYGQWTYAASYGPVWVPATVPAGWGPYRFGHWVYIPPWGWTWLDDEPWGFAPFHYGRWIFIAGRWGWVPGPVVVRPVYAPALVVFVAEGPRVAWFPLGPGEVFVPGYRCSRTYVNRVNVTNTVVNVTKITNVYNYYTTNRRTDINRITYVNRTVPGGVTAVTRETFVNARPVTRNIVRLNEREMASAPVRHIAPVEPTRASLLGVGGSAKVRPPTEINRQVVGNRMPPVSPKNVWEQERKAPPPKPTAELEPRDKRSREKTFEPPPRSVQPLPGAEVESRPVAPQSHPNVKLAPRPQPKSQQQAQEEERKFRAWQEERRKSAKEEERRPARQERSKEPHPSNGKPAKAHGRN